MSNSSIHKTFIAVCVAVVLAFALAGCDSGDGQADQPAKQAPTVTQPVAPSGSTATAPSGGNGTGGASAQSGSEMQLAPVDVTLAGDGFAESTPETVHVPSGFLVVISVKSKSAKQLNLSVLAPSTAQTFKIPPKGEQKISLDALDAGKSAKLIIGDETVKVTADAEPGP